jgi:hypothetical protein
VIGECATGSRTTDSAQAVLPAEAFETAMDELIAATMALTSAIAELAFLKGARLRGLLGCALGRAQALAEQLPDGVRRAEALHQLADMHAIATRLLMNAPSPSAAAIAGIEAGDARKWHDEARAWISGRSARGVHQIPTLRRSHDENGQDSRRGRSGLPELVREIGVVAASEPSPPTSAPGANKGGVR